MVITSNSSLNGMDPTKVIVVHDVAYNCADHKVFYSFLFFLKDPFENSSEISSLTTSK